jgi:hypothetical protein
MLRRLFGLATSAADRGAYYLRVMVPAQIAARNSSRDLKPVQDRTAAIQAGDMIVFCVLRDDAERIPLFLQYYRDLGVGHFIFIDNGSGGRLWASLRRCLTYALAHGRQLRAILLRCSLAESSASGPWRGHWCLTVMPMNCWSIRMSKADAARADRISVHEGIAASSCLVIDTYSESVESDLQSGIDPREVSRLFDRSGYTFKPAGRGCHVQGGSRARMFFPEDLDRSRFEQGAACSLEQAKSLSELYTSIGAKRPEFLDAKWVSSRHGCAASL